MAETDDADPLGSTSESANGFISDVSLHFLIFLFWIAVTQYSVIYTMWYFNA